MMPTRSFFTVYVITQALEHRTRRADPSMSSSRLRFTRDPHRRPRAPRPHDDRARRRRDAGVHAGRHAGRGEGRHASRSRIARRRDPAQQHVSPVSAARRRSDRAPRRAASLHRLDQADPHRQRRLSGVQPRRAPHDRRAGRAFPIAPRRLGAPADAGEGGRHPGAARIGHRDGARRMPRASGDAGRGARRRWSGRCAGRAARAIGFSRCATASVPGVDRHQPGPGAVRHRAGQRLPGAARRERDGRRSRSGSRRMRSAA